jgi:tetratricopeptide (TPR) repeat protein
MFTIKNLVAATVMAVVGVVAGPVLAQSSAPVHGTVKVQKADGTQVPVAGALVESYRTDMSKGSGPSATTNKRGEFSFVGFQLGYKYALAVSGPGISPVVKPDIKAGMDNVGIIVSEGDGRKASEEEVRQFVASGLANTAGKPAVKTKEQEELERKNAEIMAKNKKIQEGDEIARRANTEGVEALKIKNYDLAIAKFDEGVTAVPDYIGSTPVMLNGKLVALKARGFDKYKEGTPLQDLEARRAKYDAANQDYNEALKAYDQAMAVVKAAPAPTTPAEQKTRDNIVLELLTNAIEVHRLKAVSGIDGSRADEVVPLVEQYVALETDPAKKITARTTLGDIMRNAGQFEKAIAAYRGVLETSPDNLEVMASLGLSLVAQGTSVTPPNKEQLQEGLNYMQKYADTVQILSTDPKNIQEFKQSVKDTVEYLKTVEKLKAQPTPKAPARKTKG